MTSSKVEKISEGVLRFDLGGAKLDMKSDAKACTASLETIEVKDKRLLQSWPPQVTRIVLQPTTGGTTGQYKFQYIPAN